MKELIRAVNADKEIVELRDKYYALTGEMIPFHWKEFNIITYKEHLRKKIREAEEQQTNN